MAKITFLQGTPQQYASLTVKDANTLYFIYEKSAATASLYLGERYVAGITNLADLYDVTVSELANNDILTYNLSTQRWENASLSDIAAKIAVELNYATLQTALDTLTTDVANKANSSDVYTKTETDAAIGAAVVGAAHLKRQIVTSLNDIDIEAADALAYIYMLSTGTVYGDNKYDEYLIIEDALGERSLERVGSWEVALDGYATLADLANKADKGTTLSEYGITDAYTKTEVDSSITSLGTAIAEETSRATTKEATLDAAVTSINDKLNTIASGAEANVINEVDTIEFTIAGRKLSLKSVPASKILDLSSHETLRQINSAIESNKVDITTNATTIAALAEELKDVVRQEKYAKDLATITDAVTWHPLYD